MARSTLPPFVTVASANGVFTAQSKDLAAEQCVIQVQMFL